MTDTETITALVHQQTIIYVKFVSATLLVFDWALLFSDEVKHMWTSRWSFIKVLYLWTRYSPVADTILGLVGHFSYLTPQQCKLNDTACSILLGFGVYTSELIFIWRTFALWKGSKAVQYILGGVWLLMIPLDLYCLASYTTSAVYASQPVAGLPGCNLIKANSLVAGDFISLAMLEIAVVVLTLIKWTRPMQRVVMRTPLLLTLYRDGVLFFIYLSGTSLRSKRHGSYLWACIIRFSITNIPQNDA
ncbi:hypothetical protein BC835DRAFT_1423501 [Cytidiella melzeri]|nr:hypothetical protein BC835DRAFT_1423501 [Cytidiella melzeri]